MLQRNRQRVLQQKQAARAATKTGSACCNENGQHMLPARRNRECRRLLFHRVHDNPGDRRQHTAAGATADDLAKDAADIHACGWVRAEHPAERPTEQLTTGYAADRASKKFRQQRHRRILHEISNKAATGSAGNGLYDNRKKSFHIAPRR
jgi:hypothetical protein